MKSDMKADSEELLGEDGGMTCRPQKAKHRPRFWSYLLKKQSLIFTPKDWDWLHINRLESVRKKEREKFREKRRERIRSEFVDFLLENCEDDECLEEFFIHNIPPSDKHEVSHGEESSETDYESVKGLWRSGRSKYCRTCNGSCGLYRRFKKCELNYRKYLRERISKRVTVGDGSSESDEEESSVDLEKLFNTSKIITFLRDYKIPKIQPDWAEDSESFLNYSPETPESSNESVCCDKADNVVQGVKRRESKFQYTESSEFGEDDELEASSLCTDFTCRASSTAFCPTAPLQPISGNSEGVMDSVNSVNSGDDEEDDDADILSLHAENEEIRLPSVENPPIRKIIRFFGCLRQ